MRAYRAAKKAGLVNPIIELNAAPERERVRIIPRSEAAGAATDNEWDEVLPDGEAS